MEGVLHDNLYNAYVAVLYVIDFELKSGQQRSTALQDWLQSYLPESAGDTVTHTSLADLRSINYKAES